MRVHFPVPMPKVCTSCRTNIHVVDYMMLHSYTHRRHYALYMTWLISYSLVPRPLQGFRTAGDEKLGGAREQASSAWDRPIAMILESMMQHFVDS